jgi:toxin ParE1/3/4
MRIRWTRAAASDLEQLSAYLKENHPQYWQPKIRKIYAAVESLLEWPYRGRAGREGETRELLFPPLPYIAIYRLKEQTIEILRSYHGAQDRP